MSENNSIKKGDNVAYTFGFMTIVETVIKIRGEGDKKELKLNDIGWVSINMPTLKPCKINTLK